MVQMFNTVFFVIAAQCADADTVIGVRLIGLILVNGEWAIIGVFGIGTRQYQ